MGRARPSLAGLHEHDAKNRPPQEWGGGEGPSISGPSAVLRQAWRLRRTCVTAALATLLDREGAEKRPQATSEWQARGSRSPRRPCPRQHLRDGLAALVRLSHVFVDL